MDRERLHAQVESLNFNQWRCRAIVHAMIDAGTVTKLECQLPDCVMDSREFVAREGETSGRGQPGGKGLVIDHIIPRLQGGSDRPENLRIVHAACNTARAKGWKHTPEARARIAAATAARGGWKSAIEKRQPGWNRRMSDDQVREIRRRYAAGEVLKELAKEFGVSYATAFNAKQGRNGYAAIE